MSGHKDFEWKTGKVLQILVMHHSGSFFWHVFSLDRQWWSRYPKHWPWDQASRISPTPNTASQACNLTPSSQPSPPPSSFQEPLKLSEMRSKGTRGSSEARIVLTCCFFIFIFFSKKEKVKPKSQTSQNRFLKTRDFQLYQPCSLNDARWAGSLKGLMVTIPSLCLVLFFWWFFGFSLTI